MTECGGSTLAASKGTVLIADMPSLSGIVGSNTASIHR